MPRSMRSLLEVWRVVGHEVLSDRRLALSPERRAEIDPFNLAQLDFVLKTCRASRTLSDAGRKLYAVSRSKRSKMNDADRLKKYLARFKLKWEDAK